MFSPHIFRANDIRGLWQKDFNLSFTKNLAQGLCSLVKKRRILNPTFLIGFDARLSSPQIGEALKKHLKAQGAGVTLIGLAPSPLCYYLLSHHQLTACIVVTASHNPSEYNGFKIFFHKKHKILNPIQKLKTILIKKNLPKKILNSKGWSFSINKEKAYIESLKKEFSLKPLPFAIDTGNGALGPLAKKVFSALGLKPDYLFYKPDGRFPNHHPDPTIEKNLLHLKKRVREKNLELGFAFDGDGDRLVLVTKKGGTVLADELGFLFLKSLIQERKNQKTKALILADVKCSDWFFKAGEKLGARVLMGASGHGLIRAQMEKEKALLALEFSGHTFFNDRKERGSDDALYASLRLLEILSLVKKPLSSLLPQTPYVQTGEIRLELPNSVVKNKLGLVRNYLNKTREKFLSLDGIRLSRKTSWALFRSSKTQSALTMRFSASSKKELKDLKKEFAQVMKLKIP